MKIQNTTDISNKRIRQMIDFVKPNSVASKFTIRVTNGSTEYVGKAYTEGLGSWAKKSEDYDRPHVIARIGKKDMFPHRSWAHTKPKGGYISSLILTREEALVQIIAHELRHLWQRTHKGKRGKVWGARGWYSDRDADAYAISKTREWRRLHTPSEVYPSLDILGINGN
jgi:hypothetical protein